MWSALKSDLLDFVNTIQADTTNTLQKVLGDDEEQTTDEQSLTEKLRADVKRSYETYANPLKENKVKEFEKYKKKFSLSGFAKDIAQVLDEEPEVSRFYAELVPVEISPEEFWARLFFRLHLLSRNGSATFEDDEDEEELIWDDEDTGIEITSSIEIPIGDLNLEFLKSQEQVQHLEMENRTLKSDLAVLTEKIRQLEERIRQLSGESQDKGQNYSNHNGPLSSNLIDTASVTSSDSSSILLVAHPTEASSREESDYDTKGKGSCSKSDTKILATLEDDEEDEEALSALAVVSAWFPEYYPVYCNKNTTYRKIPPLTANQTKLVSSLQQVQAIIRHGARTPYTNYQCWKNYDISWNNCNVTELMLASPSMTSPNRPAPWLFRKLYDGSPNYLGGNCYTGQLISEGYTQEEANGQYLYDAYLNSNLQLFDTNSWTEIDTDSLIYLRSDDAQRTLMSGQILLHSMFNITEQVIVPWHTGDYGLDQIYPNSAVCPRLTTLETSIYNTPEYENFNNSQQMQVLVNDLNNILGAGYWYWDYIFDCFMTTICTGRELPDGMTQAIFNATIESEEYTQAYLNLYNNSQWAKLAMGNTAWHIKTNIQNLINNSTVDNTHPYKFALFSGHDNTIQPFLSAVAGKNWDKMWPGYASMVTIEIYNASALANSDYLFRIVYNSQVLTIPGCPNSLCDLNILLNALSFAEENMACSTTSDSSTNSNDCSDADNTMSNTDWAFVSVLSALLGGLIGVAAVIFFNKYYFLNELKRPLLAETESRVPPI